MNYVWVYLGGEEQHVQQMHSIHLETQSKGGRVFWDNHWKSCGNWKYIDGLRVMLIEFKASGKGPLLRHALKLVTDAPVKEFHLLPTDDTIYVWKELWQENSMVHQNNDCKIVMQQFVQFGRPQ